MHNSAKLILKHNLDGCLITSIQDLIVPPNRYAVISTGWTILPKQNDHHVCACKIIYHNMPINKQINDHVFSLTKRSDIDLLIMNRTHQSMKIQKDQVIALLRLHDGEEYIPFDIIVK